MKKALRNCVGLQLPHVYRSQLLVVMVHAELQSVCKAMMVSIKFLAFLAKQCWRLEKNPDLLVSRLLRAKYFPNLHIVDAPVTTNPSHVWRALHKATQILKYGCHSDSATGELSWRLNNSGIFNLKSAYKHMHLVYDDKYSARGDQSDNTKIVRFWKCIWKLPIPRKIKIFIWRGYHDGLPTGIQLCKRQIGYLHHCFICAYHIEDDVHPFITCWWSKAVWSYLGLDFYTKCIALRSMADIIFYVYSSCKPDVFCKIMVPLWFMWNHRNRVRHGSSSISPMTAAVRINMLHKDFTRNNKSLLPNINNSSLEWQTPVGNYVKINCDGAWSEDHKSGGIGVILRDLTGVILALAAKFLPHCDSVIQCEGVALREAIIMARNLHLQNVIFETDNIALVQAFVYGAVNEVSNKDWYHEVASFLSVHCNWQIVFARREANCVADFLARKAHVERWSWHRLDAVPYLSCLVQL